MAENYTDLHNRHELYVARYASHLINEYSIPNLQQAYKTARAILNESDDITSITKLNKVTAAIVAEIKPQSNDNWDSVTGEFEEFSVAESAFYAKMFAKVNAVDVSIPADKKILSYINKSLMTLTSGQSVKSDSWVKFTRDNTDSITAMYVNQIKAGFSASETVSQMSKRLRTVTNGILKNNAETLVRTGTAHYANGAREAFANDNRDVIKKKYANTVFDNRRTIQCTGYAADPLYDLDDPSAPSFPAHFGCRSNWLYMVKVQTIPDGTRATVSGKKGKEAEEAFNKRNSNLNARRDNPNIEGKTSSKVRYRGRRDTNIFKPGQISTEIPVGTWMRSQPRWYVESNMGKKRAAMFLDDGVPLTAFSDVTGRTLPLKELIASGV